MGLVWPKNIALMRTKMIKIVFPRLHKRHKMVQLKNISLSKHFIVENKPKVCAVAAFQYDLLNVFT